MSFLEEVFCDKSPSVQKAGCDTLTPTTKQKYKVGLMDDELTTVRSNTLLNVLQKRKTRMCRKIMRETMKNHSPLVSFPLQKVYIKVCSLHKKFQSDISACLNFRLSMLLDVLLDTSFEIACNHR